VVVLCLFYILLVGAYSSMLCGVLVLLFCFFCNTHSRRGAMPGDSSGGREANRKHNKEENQSHKHTSLWIAWRWGSVIPFCKALIMNVCISSTAVS
jgi:hypothetical protein